MDRAMRDALLKAGDGAVFTDNDADLIQAAEDADYGLPQNWNIDQFNDVFDGDRAKAILARQAISTLRLVADDEMQTLVKLPDFPPYLTKGAGGIPVGYNPHDPTQYFEHEETGKKYRWDGKRKQRPLDQWPNGKPHEVAVVKHTMVNGIYVPDEQEAHDANAAELDWFHRGYNVWIGNGGKPYGEVSRETRDTLLIAQERLKRDDPRNLIIRPPKAA